MDPVKNSPRASGLTSSRARVLESLREQPDPVGITALAAVTGRHPNTVREHLTWLVDAGLVQRQRAYSEGRGRPAWLYQAVGPSPGETDYAEVAAALTWSMTSTRPAGRDQVVAAVEAGRRWGRDLSRERGARVQPSALEGRRRVVDLLDDLGFAPHPDPTVHEVRLTRCPLLQAAYVNQDVVCSLHLGLAEGALEQYGADHHGAGLHPFAEPGACVLTFPGAAAST
jgi:predicted ArsR family transcriptional regulator